MQPVKRARPDPAPSRMSYRLQRWMLTPGIRLALRAGIPFAVVFAATSTWLSDEGRRDALMLELAEVRAGIEQRPEFMVKLLAIDGAGASLDSDIREILALDLPLSSFDLDIDTLRDTIAGLDPVKSASVRIRPGGILQVDVTERDPVVVWRSREGLALLDETGTQIDQIDSRATRADLPLIAGTGAEDHVAEALQLIEAAAPLGSRLRGLVWIGARRWDVVLDRNQRILLPTHAPVLALERVIALDGAQDMLERDVAVVDMRLAERPTLRMNGGAVQEWWRIREINAGGN